MLDMTCGLWVWKMWMVWMGAGGCVQVHVRHDESGCGALLVLGQAGPGDKSDPRTKATMRAGLPTGNLHAEQPAGRPAASPGDPGTRADGEHGFIYLFNRLPTRIASRTPSFAFHMRNSRNRDMAGQQPGAARSSQKEPGGAGAARRPQPEHSAQPTVRTRRPPGAGSQGKRVREAWNGWHRVAVT
jgi:hypothetical protein